MSSARSSSRSCAAITCTNGPLRVTATQAEPGSTRSISHRWPYSWNNPASLPEPGGVLVLAHVMLRPAEIAPDPASGMITCHGSHGRPPRHGARCGRELRPAGGGPSALLVRPGTAPRDCGASAPECAPGSRPAAGPYAGPHSCQPSRHDAIGNVHLQVLSHNGSGVLPTRVQHLRVPVRVHRWRKEAESGPGVQRLAGVATDQRPGGRTGPAIPAVSARKWPTCPPGACLWILARMSRSRALAVTTLIYTAAVCPDGVAVDGFIGCRAEVAERAQAGPRRAHRDLRR